MAHAALLAATALGASAASDDLDLYLLPKTVTPGGKCLDGSQAGYYYRKGTDESVYVINLKGGGACYDEASCKGRSKATSGSSKNWKPTMTGYSLSSPISSDCGENPYFCNASVVFVDYCTGDTHIGQNTEPSAASWGFYFDGHTNLKHIVEDLLGERGMDKATHVLLTGGSAGGIGTFYNADWLTARLPDKVVKANPNAGWFTPAALPNDLPDIYPPSDWAHFSKGTHGNAQSETGGEMNENIVKNVWNSISSLPKACVAAQKPGQEWICGSVHKAYKYFNASFFVTENQFDYYQIDNEAGVPKKASSLAEAQQMRQYVVQYGEAMRNSTQQVLDNAPILKKPQPDGLYHPSCFLHTVDFKVTIGGYPNHLQILGDWYFEQNRYPHRLVESCANSTIPAGLPCSTLPNCEFRPLCEEQLKADGCTKGAASACLQCAAEHSADLLKAGCTSKLQKDICSGN